MKYNSIQAMCIYTLFASTFTSAVPARAADASGWQEGFEQSVPGDQSKVFRKSWGEQGDDAFVISNEVAASGEKSLLFDRTSGTNTRMWGLAAVLPDIKTDWAVLSFSIYIQGAGNDANLSFEIRDRQSKSASLASITFKGRNFSLFSGGFKSSVDLGVYKPQVWYRVSLWLPTQGGTQNKAYAVLEESDGKGGWIAGKMQSVNAEAPANAFGTLMIVVPPEKRNFRVFLDDFSFAGKPESQRQQ